MNGSRGIVGESFISLFLITTSRGPYHSPLLFITFHLIYMCHRISGQNEMLNNCLRTVAETEDVGTEIISNLKQNRETIESAHSKVRSLNFESSCAVHSKVALASQKFIMKKINLKLSALGLEAKKISIYISVLVAFCHLS